MQTKSDNAAEVGVHVFERAGLGKAPFRFVGVEVKVYQACPGAPAQPGGSCDYCGQGIKSCYTLRSADGRQFHVGCDCIDKSGDKGLIKAYRRSPEYRAAARAAREKKASRDCAELGELISGGKLAQFPAPNSYSSSLQGHASWYLKNAGAAGRGQVLRFCKRVLLGEMVWDGGGYRPA